MDTIKADQIVEATLSVASDSLAKELNAEVIAICAPMRPPLDEIIRNEIDAIQKKERDKLRSTLAVVLETTGGFIEVVERLASVFRRHFREVIFVIPNYAYSAGTVLAMSGDEIFMDYFSVLGPIDPQYEIEDGSYVPGMGYLAKFNELLEAVNNDKAGDSTRGELSILLRKFDPARLFDIEQSVEHSKSLLEDWLPRYKFKDWTVTQTKGKKVTETLKKRRANRIAEVLGDANRWHSHGRGITIRDLASEEINLKVEDFGSDEKLNEAVRNYHGLFIDYMGRRGMKGAVHSRRGIRRVA